MIIIDEVSVVSNITLLHIHQRLQEIFAAPTNWLFAGLNVIVVGDLHQLGPIRSGLIFANYSDDAYNIYHPWVVFAMIELTKYETERWLGIYQSLQQVQNSITDWRRYCDYSVKVCKSNRSKLPIACFTYLGWECSSWWKQQ